MILLGLVAILLLGGGVAGGLYYGGAFDPKKAETKPVVVEDTGPPDANLFYDLPEMLVTLRSDGESGKFLRLGLSVECPNQDDLAKLQTYLPRVLDVFQSYVRSLTVADLRGTKNLEVLRRQLKTRIDNVIAPGKVKKLLFRGLVVQ
jgi:flagellar FliL protein